MRHIGVRIYFVIYDMLPIVLKTPWLSAVSERSDGVIAISRAVADEFAEWLNENVPRRLTPLKIGWFHLGGDIKSSVSTRGLPDDARRILAELANRPSFLMVGTIEPVKSANRCWRRSSYSGPGG